MSYCVQYFLKTSDEDVSKYLYYFTFTSLDYISDILTQHQVYSPSTNAY